MPPIVQQPKLRWRHHQVNGLENLRRKQDTGESLGTYPTLIELDITSGLTSDPEPLPGSEGMLQKPFTLLNGAEAKEGVPAGKFVHGNLETCYNANNILTGLFVKDTHMMIKNGPWDETRICVELLINGIMNDKKKLKAKKPDCKCYKEEDITLNDSCGTMLKLKEKDDQCILLCGSVTMSALPDCKPEAFSFEATFREECEKILGAICNHECAALGGLFDIWDYRAWPPRSVQRTNDVSLEDCVGCLQDDDCAQAGIVWGTETVSALDSGPWGGSPGVLMPEKIPEPK